MMENFMDFVSKGGPIIVIIMVVFLIGLFIFFEKFFYLIRIRTNLKTLRRRAVTLATQGDLSVLKQRFARNSDPFSRVVVQFVDKLKAGERMDAEYLDMLYNDNVARLSAGMRLLGTATAVSPLLGFLGTTTGMVKIFMKIREVGGLREQAQLAGGISEALYTTITGLISAITLTILSNILWEMMERYENEAREAFHYVAKTTLDSLKKGARV